MHYVLFLLLCMIWGTNFIFMKKALYLFEPTTLAWLRVAGGLLPLTLAWLWRRERWPLARRDLLPLLFVAAIGYVWPFYIQPVVIRLSDSGFVGMMICFVPLLTILVSVPLLGILPTWQQIVGVVIGLACSAVVLLSGREQHALSWSTIALAASVPLFYATCNTYIKRRFIGVRALPFSVAALAISTVLLSPIAILSDQNTSDADMTIAQEVSDTSPPPAEETDGTAALLSILSVLGLGLLGTGFGIFIFNKLLQERGPLFAGMVTYLIPFIALFWGAVDGERVTSTQLFAFIGVLSGVALVQFTSPVRRAVATAPEELPG